MLMTAGKRQLSRMMLRDTADYTRGVVG